MLTLLVAPDAMGQPVPIDLGTLGGTYSVPYGWNGRGEVVGVSSTAAGNRHAFLWTAADGMIDLGTLGGPESSAFGINAERQVVGWSDVPPLVDNCCYNHHAFSWTATGGMVDLGTLGGAFSEADFVTDSGHVFGRSSTANGPAHAFVWTPSNGMVDLGTLGGPFAVVNGVNEHDQAVGTSSIHEDFIPNHMFLWSATTGMFDLGAVLGGGTYARGINNSGQVIGVRCTGEGEGPLVPIRCNPFTWTMAGGMVDLGRLGASDLGSTGDAHFLNEAGQVAGFSNTGEIVILSRSTGFVRHFVFHATLWTSEDRLRDLGTLGGMDSEARSVNEHGAVVGRSLIAGGLVNEWHAFIWTASKGMTELPALSGREFSDAFGVTETGQVIGISFHTVPDEDAHATMWLLPASDDVTPPTLIPPATIVVNGTSPAGALVTYSVSATDDRDPHPVVVCTPPSGSVFPLLASTVSCTATDDAGNSIIGTFQIVVLDAVQQLQDSVDVIASYNLTRLGTSLIDKLQLASGFAAAGNVSDACGVLTGFLNQVRAQTGKALTQLQATELTTRAARIRRVIGC
jgi:probable HAF family extracellular repeat protein